MLKQIDRNLKDGVFQDNSVKSSSSLVVNFPDDLIFFYTGPTPLNGDVCFVDSSHCPRADLRGCERSYKVVNSIIKQVVEHLADKKKIGLAMIESENKFARNIVDWCRKLNVPYRVIDPLQEKTLSFNLLYGDPYAVADIIAKAFSEYIGRQETLFTQVQETAIKNIVLLLKKLHGNDLTLSDVVNVLREPELMEEKVRILKEKVGSDNDLFYYFQEIMLGNLKNRMRYYTTGFRFFLEELSNYKLLEKNDLGFNNYIAINNYIANGGVLIFKAATTGVDNNFDNIFARLAIAYMWNSIFCGSEIKKSNVPHVMMIDEGTEVSVGIMGLGNKINNAKR